MCVSFAGENVKVSAGAKKNLPVTAAVGTDLQWSQDCFLHYSEPWGSNSIFFYFLPSYSSLKRGNNISTRISSKGRDHDFPSSWTQWIFLVCRSEPQAHPHGQQSHASECSLDLAHSSFHTSFLCTVLIFLSLFGKVDFTISDPCFLFFK